MDESPFSSRNDPAVERDVVDATPTEAVVDAVADARDCDPMDLPPLNDAVDPDALDDLFADMVSGKPRYGGYLVFEYCDCTVTVSGMGTVVVVPDD
jgi:hypothetical protein